MTLKNNLYDIQQSELVAEGVDYVLTLRPDCPIYAAHFPGLPVTPGVCLLMMAKELLADAVHEEVTLSEVKNAKFLSVVSPNEPMALMCEIRKIKTFDNELQAQVTLRTSAEIKAKLSIICNFNDKY